MVLRRRGERAAEQRTQRVEAKASPVEFPSANAAHEVPFHEGFTRILESVFVKDVEDTFQRIRGFIDRKGARTRLDVDEANSLLRLAHDLLMTAKRERYRWELDNRVVFAKCYEEAVLDLVVSGRVEFVHEIMSELSCNTQPVAAEFQVNAKLVREGLLRLIGTGISAKFATSVRGAATLKL